MFRVVRVALLGFVLSCSGNEAAKAGEACGPNRQCEPGLSCVSTIDGGFCGFDPGDAGTDAGQIIETNCNPLTQTGCNTGEKCTWIHDHDGTMTVAALGHIGCVATGTVADGAACQFATAVMGGADNCATGEICDSNSIVPNSGTCQVICDDNTGGAPMCATGKACVMVDGVFAASGATMSPAGICHPSCNPLADNDFQGSDVGSKTGTRCGSSRAVGCYGFPSDGSGSPPPSHFTCSLPAGGYNGPTATGNLVHRSMVPAGDVLAFNTCAPGYNLSVFFDAQGSMLAQCFAFCAPVNSYGPLNGAHVGTADAGPNGGKSADGVSHQCKTPDARGAFGVAATPSGTNGEHCVFSWIFEVDPNTGMLHRSATSDTLGLCIDHTQYQYDSNGDGTITTADAVWPACPTIPLARSGSQDPLWAGDFGCVDHMLGAPDGTAQPSHQSFPHVLVQRPTFVSLPRR